MRTTPPVLRPPLFQWYGVLLAQPVHLAVRTSDPDLLDRGRDRLTELAGRWAMHPVSLTAELGVDLVVADLLAAGAEGVHVRWGSTVRTAGACA